jgi:hypothetical protein
MACSSRRPSRTLLLTLGGPMQGANAGVCTSRLDAISLIGRGAAAGLGILVAFRVAAKSAGAVVTLHATVAMLGLALMAAYGSLG